MKIPIWAIFFGLGPANFAGPRYEYTGPNRNFSPATAPTVVHESTAFGKNEMIRSDSAHREYSCPIQLPMTSLSFCRCQPRDAVEEVGIDCVGWVLSSGYKRLNHSMYVCSLIQTSVQKRKKTSQEPRWEEPCTGKL